MSEDKMGESEPEETKEPQSTPAKSNDSNWDSVEPFVSGLGTWAWVIGIVAGIVEIIFAISAVVTALGILSYSGLGLGLSTYFPWGTIIWRILSAGILILFSIIIVRPRFSNKCKAKDWNFLLNDVLILGSIRFPWMLVWGFILEIFGSGWGGLAVLVPAFLLIFLHDPPFEWKK